MKKEFFKLIMRYSILLWTKQDKSQQREISKSLFRCLTSYVKQEQPHRLQTALGANPKEDDE